MFTLLPSALDLRSTSPDENRPPTIADHDALRPPIPEARHHLHLRNSVQIGPRYSSGTKESGKPLFATIGVVEFGTNTRMKVQRNTKELSITPGVFIKCPSETRQSPTFSIQHFQDLNGSPPFPPRRHPRCHATQLSSGNPQRSPALLLPPAALGVPPVALNGMRAPYVDPLQLGLVLLKHRNCRERVWIWPTDRGIYPPLAWFAISRGASPPSLT